MIWGIYTFLSILLSPVFLLGLLLKHGFRRTAWSFRERLGLLPIESPSGKQSLWFHAASVGEWEAIREVLKAWRKRHPEDVIYLTTLTPEAKRLAQEEGVAHRVFLAPLDWPPFVRKTLSALNPRALVIVETELWPHLIRESRRSGCRILLLNGRLSERSVSRWKLLRSSLGELLECLDLLLVRSELDRERFLSLGARAEKTRVLGNLKNAAALRPKASREELSRRFGISQRRSPVLVIGSLWPGEEDCVIKSLDSLRNRWPSLYPILAPRRIEKAAQLKEALEHSGWKTALRSSLLQGEPRDPHDALVLDTLGELGDLYGLADVAVIGGGFIPRGGQNPMEAARWGAPIIFGEHMENFEADVRGLLQAGGARACPPQELEETIARLLQDAGERGRMSQAARSYIEGQSKVLEEAVSAIEKTLLS